LILHSQVSSIHHPCPRASSHSRSQILVTRRLRPQLESIDGRWGRRRRGRTCQRRVWGGSCERGRNQATAGGTARAGDVVRGEGRGQVDSGGSAILLCLLSVQGDSDHRLLARPQLGGGVREAAIFCPTTTRSSCEAAHLDPGKVWRCPQLIVTMRKTALGAAGASPLWVEIAQLRLEEEVLVLAVSFS